MARRICDAARWMRSSDDVSASMPVPYDGSTVTVSHPDFTQELPRKLLPTRAKEAQSHLRQNREFTRRCLWRVGSSLDLKRAHTHCARVRKQPRVSVIAEADRSVTTIMLPDEY